MSKDSQILFPNQALQAALNSLDIDIEQEICRYQRRKGIQRASERGLLTLGSSPKSNLVTTTTPKRPNSENPQMPLDPNILYQDRVKGKTTAALTRTATGDAPPDSYLASSEQLLRSLAEEDPKSLQGGKNSSWFNPLGIAAAVVLLIAGGALAYVLNPNLWTGVVASKKDPEVTSSKNSPAIAQKPSPTPKAAVSAPNLAVNSDFLNLDLQNLSSVETQPNIAPKPNPQVNTVVTNPPVRAIPGNQNPQNLVSALIPADRAASNSRRATTQPQASSSGLTRLGRRAPNGKVYYYVLTNYANNRSLIQGRGIARDAFIVQSPTGKKVQIATFKRKADADGLVKKLQRRGIAAGVYLD